MIVDDPVSSELTRARQRLVDLTLRNRLLNFRPTRRTTIRIVDELPGQVWRMLAEEGKHLAFLSREEHELFEPPASHPPASDEPEVADLAVEDNAGGEFDEVFSLPDVKTALEADQHELPRRYTDLFLQTPLAGEDLQTNLIRIEHQARSVQEERGVNLLFLALGFLHWRPDENADRIVQAPLILVPVALERASARRRFKVCALGEEPVVNPCLRQKLLDFRIDLPAPEDDWESFDMAAFLEAVSEAVAPQPQWQVSQDMYLGFFSFVKYLMYVDLDPRRWPAGQCLVENPMVRCVCGDDGALPEPPELPEARELDEALRPEDVFQVLNADSSQQEAILAAKRGVSLVIEGPPGTGKSQTIANIIAECLGDGRSVLFVSEKMAALEVVKRRLDAVGLGDFCLELHSTKATRRAVAHELGRVLEKGRYRAAGPAEGAEKLSRLRRRLNEYVAAVHEPYGPQSITPYYAIGRISLLADVPDVLCDLPGHEAWTPEQLGEKKGLLERLARQIRTVGPPDEHPWRGSRLTSVTAAAQRTIAAVCQKLLDALQAAGEASSRLARLLSAPAPSTIRETRALLDSAAVVIESPEPATRLLTESLWDQAEPELRTLVAKIHRLVAARRWMEGRYRWEALDAADWEGMFRRCRRTWGSVLRWLRPAYWSDRGVVKRFREAGHRPGAAELAADLRKLAEAQELRDDLARRDDAGAKYFDDAWRGACSDWAHLAGLAEWLTTFRRRVAAGRIGPGGTALASAGADRGPLEAAATEVGDLLRRWGAAWEELKAAAALEDPGVFDVEAAGVPDEALRSRLRRMADETDLLFDWARYQEALHDCRAGPLGPFVAAALAEPLEPEVLSLAMEKQFLRLGVEAVLSERDPLRRFGAADHEADTLTFARLDRQWVARTAVRLHGKLASQRPAGGQPAAGSSQLGILQGEVRRKRGGRPIRRLLADAADVIRKLKPCFMMSPLSVAQFLAPEGMRFDVVVFDEASQVEPADALGAIARGRQLVLVGDPKQLPPTPFFTTSAGEGDRPAGDDEGAAGLVDMESILDRGAMVLPTRRLRWHYRSRHESLIAFSNRRFYNNDLVTFPSCHTDASEMGLSMIHEPADAYDRGRGQTNRAQARRIAAWVFEHARRHPDLSLGVGAFSQRQQQAILDEVEKLRRDDDSLEGFFDRNKPEPFFVKNLETIQGDERDVILLSVGYGKAEPSERLSMNFGPLNQAGGWRRLNVLVTRARRRCVVFTSIVGEDFDLAATQARGVHALKAYLDFARAGERPAREAGESESDSPLVRAVFNALTERGVRLHRQVGCAGHSIDLAVVDESNPRRYVLGIECDGATFRNCATARDRDRIRRHVLESLGWRIHRVWSTEWFRSPRKRVERALEVIARARAGQIEPTFLEAPPVAQVSPGPDRAPEGLTAVEGELSVPAYECYASRSAKSPEDFYSAAADGLAKRVAAIADAEGPIRRDELVRRVCSVYGLSRAGSRIEGKINRAVSVAISHQLVFVREEFLWPRGMAAPPVRRRDEAHEDLRNIELICGEEIARAARLLLEAQFGMSPGDLIVQTARLLGFQHTGARIQERVREVVRSEIEAGRIHEDAAGALKTGEP